MSTIKILPEILSNKIAAGEVVERPAAVVKELLENALDAGATRIRIEIEKGGRALIRVSDNGSGMNHDDALLAIERYATSKLTAETDLFAIKTLGFRGEALPSIAAVSKFTLTTRNAQNEAGTEIRIEGGKIKNVTAVGAPVGSMIAVRQLFFNTPARRKFLKTTATEMGHIADAVTRIALARPAVHFELIHNQRPLKVLPATADPQQRAVEILAANVEPHLRPITYEHPSISIKGWIGLPAAARNTTRGIFTYVNGRFVRDRVIQHALLDAYRQRLMKGQYPVAVVFIDIPPDRVDVNVHPTKHEVRFLDQRRVHNTVAGIIRDGLAAAEHPTWAAPHESEPRESAVNDRRIDFSNSGQLSEGLIPPPVSDRLAPPSDVPADQLALESSESRPHPATTSPPLSGSTIPTRQPASQIDFQESKGINSLRVIGQLHGTYVVCESREGLVIIDQHAAHERVVYERLKQQVEAGKPSVQQLLMPETVELGYREATCLNPHLERLNRLGLEIESFGGNTFVVKAVPAFLADSQIAPIILTMAEKAAADGFADGVEACRDEQLKLLACHSSLRAHRRLSAEQLKPLLSQLEQCENPSHCPHGRPTWLKWDKAFIEKSFKRIA